MAVLTICYYWFNLLSHIKSEPTSHNNLEQWLTLLGFTPSQVNKVCLSASVLCGKKNPAEILKHELQVGSSAICVMSWNKWQEKDRFISSFFLNKTLDWCYLWMLHILLYFALVWVYRVLNIIFINKIWTLHGNVQSKASVTHWLRLI